MVDETAVKELRRGELLELANGGGVLLRDAELLVEPSRNLKMERRPSSKLMAQASAG